MLARAFEAALELYDLESHPSLFDVVSMGEHKVRTFEGCE